VSQTARAGKDSGQKITANTDESEGPSGRNQRGPLAHHVARFRTDYPLTATPETLLSSYD